jgi:ankyrin repeat protein
MWRIYAVDGDPSLVPADASGASPLQRALRVPDVATAEMTAGALLSNDADANPTSRADDPPLHVAAARGSAVMVEMLIRRGARHDALDREGRSAEEVAVAGGHREVAAMLARHTEIPRTHSTSRSAYDVSGRAYRRPDLSDLSQAVRSGFVGQSHRDLAGITTAAAADPRLAHSIATTGERAVEAGAHMGSKPIVDILLEHGAPYSLPTAVMRNDIARVRTLLDEDPLRINERGAHDFALLWYPVIGQCDAAMMEVLLARGADVEQQHFLGTTALHWAAQRGRPDLIDMLLDHGAEVNRPGRKFGPDPQTPLAMAVRAGQDDAARLLRQRGARE